MRFTLIFLLLANFVFANPSDSIKKKRLFLMASLGYNIGLGETKMNYPDKWGNSKYYKFDSRKPDLKTPAVGIGAICLIKELFLKADLSYFYTVRHINADYSASYKDDQGPIISSYFDFYSGPYYSTTHKVGEVFYRYNDQLNVDLCSHYLNLNLLVGFRLNKKIALTMGFRSQKLQSYYYKGKIERNVKEYMITDFPSTGGVKDSLLQTYTLNFQTNGEMRSKINQNISGSFYLNTGINYMYNLQRGVLMFDIIYDRNLGRDWYIVRDYLTFKCSYLF